MLYLWLKVFHLGLMISWFAGLFYFPRLLVNLALTQETQKIETHQHLLIMAHKLYRFMTPLMVLTGILGISLLALNSALFLERWMQIKLIFVFILIAYHIRCGYYLKQFSSIKKPISSLYYRYFNEIPVVILFIILALALFKS
jgi:putative membrane protein